MALMIGGFVEMVDSDATDGAAFFPEFTNARCFSSKKPTFESGAALSLSLGKKSTTTTTTTSALPLKKYVAYFAQDGAVCVCFILNAGMWCTMQVDCAGRRVRRRGRRRRDH